MNQNSAEGKSLSPLISPAPFERRGQGCYLHPSWEAGSVVLTEAHRLADVICYCQTHQMTDFVFLFFYLNNTK